jgi:hypothetical protein
VERAELKVQLQVAWHKVRFLQMSERRGLPKLAENKKLVCLKEEINDIIKELMGRGKCNTYNRNEPLDIR